MLAVLLNASPAEPGLRPARADGKPIAAYAERGKPIANEQGAAPMHRRFSWDALNVTNATALTPGRGYQELRLRLRAAPRESG